MKYLNSMCGSNSNIKTASEQDTKGPDWTLRKSWNPKPGFVLEIMETGETFRAVPHVMKINKKIFNQVKILITELCCHVSSFWPSWNKFSLVCLFAYLFDWFFLTW